MIRCKLLQHRYIDSLVTLHEECFAAGWGEDSFLLAMEGGAKNGLVALLDGEPVGGVLWQQVADEAEIITLFTDKFHRKAGVGSALLSALCNFSDDVTKIFLEVNQGNVAAVKLYEKHGFVVSGVRKNYYTSGVDEPEDALVMELLLQS